MCGIAGKITFDGRPIEPAWLATATGLIAHRGPDREQSILRRHRAGTVALGHRRLRVIDLDPCADQPMTNQACVDAGRATPLAIVYNGEIYNFRELRRGLESRGHRFATQSDTEVILHLYEEAGAAVVNQLRGMFAFAIWDEKSGTLFCARDRVGKKPFYYCSTSTAFWFASEPRAILSDPDVPDVLNPGAIQSYLSLGYVPAPESAFAALRRLPAAHRARVSERGVEIERYWHLDYEPKQQISLADAARELRDRVRDAVRVRLESDVPLGTLLSGGIDSTIVAACAAAESSTRLRTYSIGFEDPAYDELSIARNTARRLGTDHHELVITPRAADHLERLAWHYGEPYGDSSALPTFYVSEFARRHVTVALNGDGGDESFGGYRRYVAHALAERWRRAPGLARLARRLGAHLPRPTTTRSRRYDLQRFVSSLGENAVDRYVGWFGLFHHIDLASVARGAADPVAAVRAAFARNACLHPIDQAMGADIETYLPDDLLVKVDIASMAFGLEGRSPLLDHQVMEWAARLPVEHKVRGRTGKYLLRKAFADVLPAEITGRTKTGFGIPVDAWFRGELRPVFSDLVLGSGARIHDYLDARAIRELWESHQEGREAHGHRLWALLMLEIWHRTRHTERLAQRHAWELRPA